MTRIDKQYLRKAADFYPTYDAEDVVRAIKDYQWLPNGIWEPHAGARHLSKALIAAGHDVVESDLHPQNPGTSQKNFLTETDLPEGVGAIVMNPPYDAIDDHLSHALELTMPKGGVVCLLCRSDWAFAAKRQVFLMREDYVGEVKLLWRLRWVPRNQNRYAGRHNFCVQLWDASPFGPPTGTQIIGTARKAKGTKSRKK